MTNRLTPLIVSERFLQSEGAALLYVNEVLDGSGRFMHLDTTLSMSGMIRFDSALDCRLNQLELFPEESPHGS